MKLKACNNSIFTCDSFFKDSILDILVNNGIAMKQTQRTLSSLSPLRDGIWVCLRGIFSI